MDAEGSLKAYGAGDSEVLEGTIPESFSTGGNDKSSSLQLSITPKAMITIARLADGRIPSGTHPYTVQGTCMGHSITGTIEKITQVSIQLSR
jgi:hypothetical protein